MKTQNISRRSFVVAMGALSMGALFSTGLTGCSTSTATNASNTAAVNLSGHQLNIYCGAGMTNPFKKIAEQFEAKTGCKMNVTYGNAATIQNQINTTNSGDFFIAGSADELKPVSDKVDNSVDLVKHIPVIAVPDGNPAKVSNLADLANVELLLIGDPESTPIGKIAKKALTDAGIWEGLSSAGKINTSTTAPQIAAALENGQGSAGIVWKENAGKCAIVAESDMGKYIKTVPSARLKCAADADAAKMFDEYLASDEAQQIWVSFGYELLK